MQQELKSAKIMTIINATSDSFFGASRTISPESIAITVKNAVSQGADILDVGGYSSRPGADEVSEKQEFERVKLAMQVIRDLAPEIEVSLDTFRSSVAEKVIDEFGSVTINDISAGELDNAMLDVVANARVPYIAMHMRGRPENMQTKCDYDNITETVLEYFERKLELFSFKGIENVTIDPGFGFAKTLEQNYELLASLGEFKRFGLPVLVGVSRKSMIYKLLDTTPEDALTGTIALNWVALESGADILRVHDTREAVQMRKIFNYYGSINSNK